MGDAKPLTPAQVRYLKQLNADFLYAKKAFDGFMSYLRETHSAPESEGWQIFDANEGFTQPQPTQFDLGQIMTLIQAPLEATNE